MITWNIENKIQFIEEEGSQRTLRPFPTHTHTTHPHTHTRHTHDTHTTHTRHTHNTHTTHDTHTTHTRHTYTHAHIHTDRQTWPARLDTPDDDHQRQDYAETRQCDREQRAITMHTHALVEVREIKEKDDHAVVITTIELRTGPALQPNTKPRFRRKQCDDFTE